MTHCVLAVVRIVIMNSEIHGLIVVVITNSGYGYLGELIYTCSSALLLVNCLKPKLRSDILYSLTQNNTYGHLCICQYIIHSHLQNGWK